MKNGNGNRPMQGRCNYGGAGGEARPDAKMGHRHKKAWPYFNREPDFEVTKGIRQVLKHVSAKKRRQRDKTSKAI